MTVCGRAKIRFTDHPTSHLVAKPVYNNNNNNTGNQGATFLSFHTLAAVSQNTIFFSWLLYI
jgi:hypothetical protein